MTIRIPSFGPRESHAASKAAVEPLPEYYRFDVQQIVNDLGTDVIRGLSNEEASKRLEQHGPNSMGDDSGPSALKVLANAIFNSMNAVLFIAFLIAAIARDPVKSVVLIVIIATNSYLSFRQEYKSEKTMEALRKLSADSAAVLRSGELVHIDATLLVPGDIVQLEEGDHVPADIRLLESVNLSTNEALLTGEPMPIRKHTDPIPDTCPLGDRKNCVYKSTMVAYGRGKGIVVATGKQTEIGKIAEAVLDGSNQTQLTPLERTMRRFMFICLLVAILLGIVVFWVNGWNFGDTQVLLYAIGVAVAILPEGLPAVTTVAMALGVSTMAQEKAIVRKLVSLEALGMVTNICSDKTGTLTEGRMSAVTAWLFGVDVTITGSFAKEGTITGLAMDSLKPFLDLCGLCNTCSVTLDTETGTTYQGKGDTTEIALAVVAHRHGHAKEKLVGKSHTFFAEYPFDSNIKRMSVLYREGVGNKNDDGDVVMYSKGAIESLLPRCTAYFDKDGVTAIPMTKEYEQLVHHKAHTMATQGLRVLCIALRRIQASELAVDKVHFKEAEKRNENENKLVLLGLVGIMDPPREETKGAVAHCHQAGIKVHMITGDGRETAAAVSRQIGILPTSVQPGSEQERTLVMTSMQFDAMTEEELDALPQLPLVIARCSPETKVKMVQALHRRDTSGAAVKHGLGKKYRRLQVAVTGDGVNDAPAIAYADVGIAMGQGGADVTKQAADISLTDDNFATIVSAIKQGRRIFANIQKFTGHLLSGNVSEVVALIIGLVFHDGLGQPIFPMSAIQILWLNLVTSSPIALALAMEPASREIMKVKPREEGVFTWEFIADTGILGSVMGGLTLLTFCLVGFIHAETPLNALIPRSGANCNKSFSKECEVVYRARGVGFVTLCMLLLVHGINCRSARRSLFHYNWVEAKVLLWAIVGGAVFIVPLPYIPVINTDVFYHSGFSYEWGYVTACCVVFMVIVELYKLIKRQLLPAEWVLINNGGEYELVETKEGADATTMGA